VTLTSSDARISSVEASWREQNLPPRVEELRVSVQGQDVREGELTTRSEPITQALPGGQRVEYSLAPKSSSRSLREVPVWAQGLRTATWRGVDPNGDPLRYRLDLQPDAGEQWILLQDDVKDNAYTFDTHALPDGRYRLRVQASDRDGNAAGEDRNGEAVSAPFTVDNTPPSVVSLEANPGRGSIRVEGEGRGCREHTVAPRGRRRRRGLAPRDARRRLRGRPRGHDRHDAPDMKPGTHTVGVRAVDAAGNSATRARIVTVSTAR
jgi:hypothetical protein